MYNISICLSVMMYKKYHRPRLPPTEGVLLGLGTESMGGHRPLQYAAPKLSDPGVNSPIHLPPSPAAVSDTQPENPDQAEQSSTPTPVIPGSRRQQSRHSCWHGNYFVILRQVLCHMQQGDRQNHFHLFFCIVPCLSILFV